MSVFSFGIQNHPFLITRCLEQASLLSYDVQSRPSQFGIHSHHIFSVWAFRVILHSFSFRAAFSVQRSEPQFFSLVRHSEPPFLTARCSEPPSLLSLAFRATISFQFGVQSHISSLAFRVTIFLVWHSEPCFQSGIQSRISSLVFKVSVPSQFGVQSYHPIMIGYSLPPFRRSEPSFIVRNSKSSFIPRVQSHHIFSLIFRAISQSVIQSHHFRLVWRSEPHSQHLELSFSFSLAFRATFLAFKVFFLFQFGIQSHITSIQDCHFLLVQHSESFLPFKATFINFRRSESCLHFDIQSHCPTWHSMPPSSFSFGIQSCRAYSFRHLESPSFLFLVFRVIFPQPCHSQSWLLAFMFTGIAHLAFTILCSSSFSSPRYLVLIVCSSRSSRLLLPLHMTQSIEFTTHISITLLGTLHLAFSCSSHRAIPFGRILSYT